METSRRKERDERMGKKKWKCKNYRERQDCEGHEEKLEARCESILMHLFLLYRLSLCFNLAQRSLLKTSTVKRLHKLHDRLLQIKILTSLQTTVRGAHSHIKLTLKLKSSLIIAPICPSLFVFLSKRDLKQVITFIPKLLSHSTFPLSRCLSYRASPWSKGKRFQTDCRTSSAGAS